VRQVQADFWEISSGNIKKTPVHHEYRRSIITNFSKSHHTAKCPSLNHCRNDYGEMWTVWHQQLRVHHEYRTCRETGDYVSIPENGS